MFCTDCKDAPIIVPEYNKDHLVEEFGCIDAKQAYIAAARQFVKTCHPPIRLFKPIISSVFLCHNIGSDQ